MFPPFQDFLELSEPVPETDYISFQKTGQRIIYIF